MDQYGVRLLHVGDGEIPGPELFWMSDWDEWFPIAFQCVLIQGDGVNALFSTGAPEDLGPMNAKWEDFLGERARMRRTDEQFILTRLSEVGLSPGDVTHIFLSPLQRYTTSNVPAFPNAEVCMSKRGWLHFHSTRSHLHDDRWECIPQDVLRYLIFDAWDRVRLLDDEDEVLPGLRTWWSGGHHRASFVLEVDTPEGVVTVTDSYFVRRNLDENHPIGICENIYEAMACHERIKDVSDIALTIYDPGQLTRFRAGIVAEVPG